MYNKEQNFEKLTESEDVVALSTELAYSNMQCRLMESTQVADNMYRGISGFVKDLRMGALSESYGNISIREAEEEAKVKFTEKIKHVLDTILKTFDDFFDTVKTNAIKVSGMIMDKLRGNGNVHSFDLRFFLDKIEHVLVSAEKAFNSGCESGSLKDVIHTFLSSLRCRDEKEVEEEVDKARDGAVKRNLVPEFIKKQIDKIRQQLQKSKMLSDLVRKSKQRLNNMKFPNTMPSICKWLCARLAWVDKKLISALHRLQTRTTKSKEDATK